MTKRRIQVDQDFNSHALELLSKTQREIPEVMHEQIANHEKAMKLNPPVDKRTKTISMESLEKTQAQLKGQARVFEVVLRQAQEPVLRQAQEPNLRQAQEPAKVAALR